MRYFTTDLTVLSVVMLAAIVGHVYPVFFQFKGGKGVATLIGGLVALSPILCGIYLLTWLAVFVLTRLSSLSALVATATMPLWALWIARGASPVCFLLAIFVFWRHRSNIQHLLAGTEDKSTFK
jgi:glycerol-3-phosphate acyltransferase PlsY